MKKLDEVFPKCYHPDLVPRNFRSDEELDKIRQDFAGGDIRGPSEKQLFDAGYVLGKADALSVWKGIGE